MLAPERPVGDQSETREILIAVEGHDEAAAEDVKAALADLARLLAEHASVGRLEHALLTAEDPSFSAG